jgi:vanillate O-demethylase monooxygenase subunit
MSDRSFPLNCWYMAAWADEVRDTLLARRLFGRPIVMARFHDGAAVAFDDRCPHRFAPLSLGRLKGDRIECGYHGLQFGRSGACIANPGGGGHFPPGTRTRAYPLVERHRILWIWPGDPALADPASIPDLALIPPAGGHDNIGNYLHVKANWLLETDNIMDLTHVGFLHDGSLGNATMRAAEVKVSERDGTIRAVLWMPDTLCGFGPMQGQPCDQWNNVVWMAPSIMMMDFGAVPPGAEPIQDKGAYAFHIFTPETEHSTHYFFGSSGSYGDDEAWIPAMVREAQSRVFLAEDNPMVEGVADRMGGEDFWSLKPAILPSDAAAIRVRRRIAQMCREERSAVVADKVNLVTA